MKKTNRKNGDGKLSHRNAEIGRKERSISVGKGKMRVVGLVRIEQMVLGGIGRGIVTEGNQFDEAQTIQKGRRRGTRC